MSVAGGTVTLGAPAGAVTQAPQAAATGATASAYPQQIAGLGGGQIITVHMCKSQTSDLLHPKIVDHCKYFFMYEKV